MSVTKRKNILFLASWYPNRVIPGNGIFIQKHAEAVALTNNVYVLHIITDPLLEKIVELTENKTNNVTNYICYLPKVNTVLHKYFLYLRSYFKVLSKLPKIDIVHLHVVLQMGIFALYHKIVKKTPYIITEHWTHYQKPMNSSISPLQKRVIQTIVKNAVFVCPVSTHLQKAMLDFGLPGNYLPVPNIVDTNIFKPSHKNNDKFCILHISNMDNEHKNVSGILRVFSSLQHQIPEAHITLVGTNSITYKREAKALEILPEQIAYIDYCDTKEISQQIQQSDVFVLFSNYENLPCVILEAFACGIPVISSDVGGIHEYFPEDFGSLVPAKDEASLEKAILELYTSKPFASPKKMHTYAAEHFSPKAINRTFSKIYEQAIALNS